MQEAQGAEPVLRVPPQKKKKFGINDVPVQLRSLLREFEDIFQMDYLQGYPHQERLAAAWICILMSSRGHSLNGEQHTSARQRMPILWQNRLRTSAGAVLVGKKDADGVKTDDRMCRDFRPLNAHTVPDHI